MDMTAQLNGQVDLDLVATAVHGASMRSQPVPPTVVSGMNKQFNTDYRLTKERGVGCRCAESPRSEVSRASGTVRSQPALSYPSQIAPVRGRACVLRSSGGILVENGPAG